jgi:hypothetical protein
MAPAASIAFSRKPAPLEVAWMFCRGKHLLVCAYLFLSFGWGVFIPGGAVGYFAVASVMLAPLLAISAGIIDARARERLAFASLLPRAHSAKWLVLAPLCALASLLVVLSTALPRRSPLVGVAVLGCCWWAIAMGRWLGRRWWVLPAIPAVALAPLATGLTYRAGGWGAAAAVSMALAAVGFLLSPEVRLDVAGNRADGRDLAVAGPRSAVSVPGAQATGFASAIRLWWLGARHVNRWILICSVVALVFQLRTSLWMLWSSGFMLLALTMSIAIGKVSKPDRYEFLGALPLTRRRLFAGNILPWLLPALIVPAVLLLHLHLQSSRAGWIAGAVARGDRLASLEFHLLVPAIPKTWEAGGFPMELWAPLVIALRDQFVGGALYGLALLLAFSAASLVSDRKHVFGAARRWLVYVLLAAVWFGTSSNVPHRQRSHWLMLLLIVDLAIVFGLAWLASTVPTVLKRERR